MPLSENQMLDNQRSDPRIVRLWKALRPLQSCVSFMNTGAHPDDETTSMLAAMILRDGIQVSHACSTRGEGGQNVLGPEVTKDLGVIRTREMERAAGVLGFTQYWLSETPDDDIFDFGFSKSGGETLGKWGEARTLKRFVEIIRRERPDIICPTFLDVPGQHGHHRAMTRSAFKAVEMAADPDVFPELSLASWRVKKLYLPAWSGAGDSYDDDLPPPPATVVVDATGSDPVLGADYAQIAQWSRGFHKTQGMGRWVQPGTENSWPLNLAWRASGDRVAEQAITDGLPGSLSELARYAGAPQINDSLRAAGAAIDATVTAFPNYDQVSEYALEALRSIARAIEDCPDAAAPEVLHRLTAKNRQLSRVIEIANDVRVDLTFSVDQVRPGETFGASLQVFSPTLNITAGLNLPEGWSATLVSEGRYEIMVAKGAQPSDPYPDTWYPDRANSSVWARTNWQMKGLDVTTERDPAGRIVVLPSHSANLDRHQKVMLKSALEPVTVQLSDQQPANSVQVFEAPIGWSVSMGGLAATFVPDETVAPGLYEFPLMLNGNAASIPRKMEFAHIGAVHRNEAAVFRVRVLDVRLPNAKIAYIGGGSDRTDGALRDIGMQVDSIADKDIAGLDLTNYSTVLIGIFAFRTCPALAARVSDLRAWVEAGGNLVTLYHRPWDNWDPQNTPPRPIGIGKPSLRWRVTDENALVTHLLPQHDILNSPNKIGPADWTDWKKERGLYFASEWDESYQALLSMADPGEDPLLGSLLCADIGAGRHTHVSLIIHHQLENLVPGAYRLFANILAGKSS